MPRPIDWRRSIDPGYDGAMRLAPVVNLSAALHPAPNGRAGIMYTVRLMRDMVNAYRVAPQIIAAATGIIYTTPEKDETAEARAIFEFVRDHVRYVRDVHGVETLANPVLTLLRGLGDCDDQATLLATMLEAVGYPTRFVVAAYRSAEFEHVYVQAMLSGEWVDLDPTEREPMGYSPPGALLLWIEGA